MALLLGRRRNVGMKLESISGTPNAPNMATDNLPLLRSVTPTIEPISVERPILRLTMTPYGDIYPGKSLGTIDVVFELTSNAAYTGLSGNTNTSASMYPTFLRPLSISSLPFNNNAIAGDVLNHHAYKVTPPAGVDAGPLRHGENVTGTGVTGGNNWTVIGDTFADDGVLVVAETANEGGLTGGTLTGVTSGTQLTVSTRGPQLFAFHATSDVNGQINNGLANATVDLYDDGKRLRLKGCAGETEFQFDHSNAILVHCTFRGVVDSYVDNALPASVFESVKSPPKFLGTRVSLRRPINAPAAVESYGTDGAGVGTITGSLNTIRLKTGNEIVLPQNSMDPNGVNYAIVTGRNPEGSFNPYEVLSSTDFDFLTSFFQGKPLRLRISAIGPGAAVLYNDPTTTNFNIFEFIAPGIVLSQMGDTSRDGINTWDGKFKLSGGNYSASVAQSETPGQDNELTILHR
jgi:hypothetical protein